MRELSGQRTVCCPESGIWFVVLHTSLVIAMCGTNNSYHRISASSPTVDAGVILIDSPANTIAFCQYEVTVIICTS